MRQRILQSRFPSVYPTYPALTGACAIADPDADQWKEAMDLEMENLKSHDVYELVARTNGMRILKLGWALARSSKTAFSRGTRED